MPDVIVVGGGIVGTSAAYHLAKAGADALLIDRADTGRATDAGAGILSAETGGLGIDDAWFRYALDCVGYYPELIAQLKAEDAGETGYAQCGKLIAAVEEHEVPSYTASRAAVFQRQRQRGTPSSDDLYEVDAAGTQELFPAIARTYGAIFFRHGARVDGRLLNAAMLKAASAHGLTNQTASVDQLIIEQGTIKGVIADGDAIHSDRVIIAGGAWSAHFGEQLGAQIPVEPMRGQIIHFDLPGVDTSTWPVVIGFGGHYMVAWDDSRVVVGATYEPGSGFHPHTTAAGVHEVLTDALRMAPGLAEARIREIRVGLRPATVDGLPVLGEIPGVAGLFIATGMGATGLQLGPYSGKLASDWAQNGALDTDISAFNLTRFGS